jgi:adenine deaminase
MAAASAPTSASSAAQAPPDTILFNGVVATMVDGQPFQQAVALGSGKVLAVGSNAVVRALKAAHTCEIDVGGRVVIPGRSSATLKANPPACSSRVPTPSCCTTRSTSCPS